MVMFRKLPILAAAVVVVAMSVAPASARKFPAVHNVTVDNSYYGFGAATGPLLYPNSSYVELIGTSYAVPKSVIAYWPTYGWYRRGGY
jgi:hypothetical protein